LTSIKCNAPFKLLHTEIIHEHSVAAVQWFDENPRVKKV